MNIRNFTPPPVLENELKLLDYSEEGSKRSYTMLRLIIQWLEPFHVTFF